MQMLIPPPSIEELRNNDDTNPIVDEGFPEKIIYVAYPSIDFRIDRWAVRHENHADINAAMIGGGHLMAKKDLPCYVLMPKGYMVVGFGMTPEEVLYGIAFRPWKPVTTL